MTTHETALVSHGDTDFTAIFARKMEAVFGRRVSVLPNVAVLNSARRQTRRGGEVEVSVAADINGLFTVYRAGRDYLLIDAATNATTDLMDIVMDGDTLELWIADRPELAMLLRGLQATWEHA